MTFGGQFFDDLFDVANEAHIEHAIGFIEHEHLYSRQVDVALPHMIQQSARCRDNDIDTAANFRDLWSRANATVDFHAADGTILAIGVHALVNLRREFAGRCENQCTNAARAVNFPLQPLQHGQREGRGLTGTRLGARENIVAFENMGDSFALNRGGFVVALFFDSTQQFGRQAELLK